MRGSRIQKVLLFSALGTLMSCALVYYFNSSIPKRKPAFASSQVTMGDVSVKVKGGAENFSVLTVGNQSLVQATKNGVTTSVTIGDPSKSLFSSFPDPKKTEPPLRIQEQQRLIGGLSRLSDSVFLTARHVLQGLKKEDLIESLNNPGNHPNFRNLKLSPDDFDYYIFHLSKNYPDESLKESIDAVLAVGKNIDKIQQASFKVLLPHLEASQSRISIGDRYYSHQLRLFTSTRSGEADDKERICQLEVKTQISDSREIQSQRAAYLSRYFLCLSDVSGTAPGSSGSLVHTRNPKTRTDWAITGMIECALPLGSKLKGIPIPPSIQVIPLSLLAQATLVPISLNEILEGKLKFDPDCIETNAREAGGL